MEADRTRFGVVGRGKKWVRSPGKRGGARSKGAFPGTGEDGRDVRGDDGSSSVRIPRASGGIGANDSAGMRLCGPSLGELGGEFDNGDKQ